MSGSITWVNFGQIIHKTNYLKLFFKWKPIFVLLILFSYSNFRFERRPSIDVLWLYTFQKSTFHRQNIDSVTDTDTDTNKFNIDRILVDAELLTSTWDLPGVSNAFR